MENEKFKEAVEEMVNEIYTVDQNQIDEKFIAFLGALERAVGIGAFGQRDVNKVLNKVQEAYVHKDYIRLSDILLYELT